MFENLDIFRMAQSMAIHAGKRQALIAQNIANADTPGYKPMEIKSFSEVLSKHQTQGEFTLHTLPAQISDLEPFAIRGGDSPNGNAVSVEQEMVKAIDTRRQHDQALAIYKSALTIMRRSLGR